MGRKIKILTIKFCNFFILNLLSDFIKNKWKVLINFKNKIFKNITHSTPSSTLLQLTTLVQGRSEVAQGERGEVRIFKIERIRNVFEQKIRKNLNQGFSFIEVTVTIAIIGMMITALFSLQYGAFRNVTTEHAILSRIFYIKNIFFDPQNFQKLQKDKVFNQDIADPKMKINCKFLEVPEKSEAKKFEDVHLIRATGSWQGIQTEQQESLICFVYVKPKEEKKTT